MYLWHVLVENIISNPLASPRKPRSRNTSLKIGLRFSISKNEYQIHLCSVVYNHHRIASLPLKKASRSSAPNIRSSLTILITNLSNGSSVIYLNMSYSSISVLLCPEIQLLLLSTKSHRISTFIHPHICVIHLGSLKD